MIVKITLLLLVVYVAFECGYFAYAYTHIPVLPTIDQSEKTLGSGPVLRYMAAGDSTGVGEGASRVEKTYTYHLAEFLAKTHTVEYKNVSVKGYTTQDVLEKQVSQIIAFKPDLITISMGANDATHLVPSEKVLQNYKTIITRLEEGTAAKIYITDVPNFKGATIVPWLYRLLLEYRSQKLNPQLRALEDARVKIIDIHAVANSYAADHFHPSDLGYQRWATAFLSRL